jgi:hypothetical protein
VNLLVAIACLLFGVGANLQVKGTLSGAYDREGDWRDRLRHGLLVTLCFATAVALLSIAR